MPQSATTPPAADGFMTAGVLRFRPGRRRGRFELADFVGVVHLLFRAGQARLQLGDFLAEDVDAFLGFFVHGGGGGVSCESSVVRSLVVSWWGRHRLGPASAGLSSWG